jgi:hypothetical protein
LLVVGVVGSLGLVATPARAVGPLHQQTVRHDVVGGVTSVSVRDDDGNVTIAPGTPAAVVASERYNYAAPAVAQTLRDGVLSIVARCPRQGPVNLGLNDCSVDLALAVPRDVTVHVADSLGDITTRDLRGNESVHSDLGDVRIDGVVGNAITATSSEGEVRLVGVRGQKVTLSSDDGDIDATLPAAPRSVVARSSTGDVDLTVPAGVYAVRTRTEVGTVTVRGVTVSSDAPRSLSAQSDNGDIMIRGVAG